MGFDHVGDSIALVAKCYSHRARQRLLRFLTRKPQYRGWARAKGGEYWVTPAEAEQIREARLDGVTVPRHQYLVHASLLDTLLIKE